MKLICLSISAVSLICVAGFGLMMEGEREPVDYESMLAEVRNKSLQQFTLEVEVDLPVHIMPGQGRATRRVRVTAINDTTAIVWKATTLPPPKYFSPSTPAYQAGDFDRDGNLGVAMSSDGATIRDGIIHDEYTEDIGFRVSADGKITRAPGIATLSRRRPDDLNTVNLNMLREILCALGRPLPDQLGAVLSADTARDGESHVRVMGGWGLRPGTGVTKLVIDEGEGALVRRASYGVDGEPPRKECWSEGSRRFGDVVLAEQGECTYLPSGPLTVRLISFSQEADPSIAAEARKMIARGKTRLVRVADYRDDPTRPVERLVPAGELNLEE